MHVGSKIRHYYVHQPTGKTSKIRPVIVPEEDESKNVEEKKDKANALVETKTWRLSEDDDEDDDNDDEEDSRPWRGCCIATRNAKTLEGQIELVEEDEFTHIVGSINEGELRRIL